MSIMGILDIGSKALAAHKTAIDVTGQNIANANVAGYSRQTVNLESAPGSVNAQFNIGNGVNVANVQRSHDIFLQTQIQYESSTNGKQTILQDGMGKLEPLFNDTAATGLSASLGEFFTSWQDLSMNPQGTAERQTVLSKAQTVVDDFNRISQSLTTQSQQTNDSLTTTTGDISTKLKQIADLNAQIKILAAGGDSANPLRDSRDKLLQDLSHQVGISTQEQGDGTMTVTLGSNATGPQLVSGTTSMILGVDTANPAASAIVVKSSAADSGTDVTAIIAADNKSGELGGALQLRDQVIPGFMGKLDELAFNVATQVNTLHAAGTGLTGSTGKDFFVAPTASSGYSAAIGLSITSTNDVAAGGAQSTGTGDNRNALLLAGLKTSSITVAGAQTTLPGMYNSLVGAVGVASQNSQQGLTQSSSMLTQLSNLKESITGVAMDEELSKLIAYQKGYEGAAKLITTGQAMIDTVLNMVR
jgi:flagellar hook-associated protein 1